MSLTQPLRLPDGLPGMSPEAIRVINDRLARLASVAVAAAGPLIQNTHAMRIGLSGYNPVKFPAGTLLYETDRTVTYVARGAHWMYYSGLMSGLLSAIPTDLGPHDAGFLFFATDYLHTWQWQGTQWDWAPGDDQSGYFRDFALAPAGAGWKACDGTATTYVDRRAATHAITPPDMTASVYRRGAAAYTGTVGAAGTIALAGTTSDVSAGTPAGTVSAPALTMNSYTPAGTVSAPALTMNSYTPAGTVSAIAATASGANVVVAGGGSTDAAINHTHPAPTFTGTAATLTGSVAAPAFTGTAATLTGTISTPAFSGTALAAHHHDISGATATLSGDPVKNVGVLVYFRR